MKKILGLLPIILFYSTVKAQPEWNWIKTGSENGNSVCGDIAVGKHDDIFITGEFTGLADFESNMLNSSGGKDIFVTKYNSSGQFLWARSAGGSGDETASAVAVDGQGNVFVAGSYTSSILVGNISLVSLGGKDIFLAKYNSNGDLQWAKSAGGQYDEEIGVAGIGSGGLAIDAEGNILMTGMFSGYGGSPPVYGTALFDTVTLISSGNADVFVTKYTTDGNIIWGRSGGGRFSDRGCDITSDISGNVCVTGYFNKSSSVYFDTFKLTAEDFSDVFTVRYSKDGTVTWAKSGGGNSVEEGRSIAVGRSGNIYVAGSTVSNSYKFGSQMFNSRGQGDAFLVSYDTTGNIAWAKSIGWLGGDIGFGVATDGDENIYVTGAFDARCFFDGDSVNSNGGEDMYIAKYDKAGNVVWALNVGGKGSDRSYGIAIDGYGQAVVTGRISSDTAYFPPYAAFGPSIFVARLDLFSVGIKNVAVSDAIHFGPNPATDVLHIKSLDKYTTYKIVDIAGRQMLSGTISQPGNSIDVSLLSPGTYFLQLSESGKNSYSKFIKL